MSTASLNCGLFLTCSKVTRVSQFLSMIWDRQDSSQFSGKPLEKLEHWMCGPTLPIQGKKLGSKVFPVDHMAGVRVMVRGCLELFHWFHSFPEYRGLSTSFWISHQGNLCCVAKSVLTFSLRCCSNFYCNHHKILEMRKGEDMLCIYSYYCYFYCSLFFPFVLNASFSYYFCLENFLSLKG